MASVQTLTVTFDGRVYLSKALAAGLDLKPRQRLDLVPPLAKGGGTWHLDLRTFGPIPALTWTPSTHPMFRTAYDLRPAHFQIPGGRGRPRIYLSQLLLELDTEIAPGYWKLRRVRPDDTAHRKAGILANPTQVAPTFAV